MHTNPQMTYIAFTGHNIKDIPVYHIFTKIMQTSMGYRPNKNRCLYNAENMLHTIFWLLYIIYGYWKETRGLLAYRAPYSSIRKLDSTHTPQLSNMKNLYSTNRFIPLSPAITLHTCHNGPVLDQSWSSSVPLCHVKREYKTNTLFYVPKFIAIEQNYVLIAKYLG